MITQEEGISNNCIIKAQLKLLRLVCMWPLKARSLLGKSLAYFYFFSLVACLIMCTIGLLIKACITQDLVDRSEAIDIFTLTGTGVVKLVFFAYHQKRMRSLVDFADLRFPRTALFGEDQLHIDRWMRLCGMLSCLHCFGAFFCIFFWGICPILNFLFGVTPLSDMPLPMNVWYPWDISVKSPYFLPQFLLHLFGLLVSTHVYMSCDGFFFSFIFFILGQIRILKLSLRGIKDVQPEGKESMEKVKENELKKCIELHNKILAFLRELDLIFRTMIVADILHAIVSLSFAMFQMSESKGILENMKMILFISYCFTHQYLNSHFGQILINEQESLMNEIYGVDWTGESHPFKKSIHIMMTASVTPVKFSAWRMYFLQYETFVEFCRMMVSVFMVLRTLKNEK